MLMLWIANKKVDKTQTNCWHRDAFGAPASRRVAQPLPPAVGGFMFERVAAQRIARVRNCLNLAPGVVSNAGESPNGRPANRGVLLFGSLFLDKQDNEVSVKDNL